MQAAAVREAVSQVDKFNSATNTFRLKFNCLPGDCLNATDFGFTAFDGDSTSYVANGDGDGVIYGHTSMGVYVPTGFENSNYWSQLYQAHLIAAKLEDPATAASWHEDGFPGLNSPTSSVVSQNTGSSAGRSFTMGGWWLAGGPKATQYSDPTLLFPGNFFLLTGNNAGAYTPATWTPINPAIAFAIDTKIDDGFPTQGKVRAIGSNFDDGLGNWGLHPPLAGVGAGVCINNAVSPNTYRVQESSNVCGLAIGAAF